jgi:hypothetical protein
MLLLFDHLLSTLKSEAVGSSETLVNMYKTTDGHSPEDSILQKRETSTFIYREVS